MERGLPAQASLCWVSSSWTDTQALAAQLACCLVPGLVIALHGDLGAGKTTFVQGLAAGLGVRERVTSPTFILANEYQTPRGWRLVHVDAYRLAERGADEAAAFGLEELLDATDTIVAIEWAERVADLLPADCLQIWLQAEEAAPAGDSPEDHPGRQRSPKRRSFGRAASCAQRPSTSGR